MTEMTPRRADGLPSHSTISSGDRRTFDVEDAESKLQQFVAESIPHGGPWSRIDASLELGGIVRLAR